jgi:hypothetical protein
MSKTIKDAVADVGMELCRCVDRANMMAKEHAFKALDGDQTEAAKAREYRAQASAYETAMKQVDGLRFAIERGDFKQSF